MTGETVRKGARSLRAPRSPSKRARAKGKVLKCLTFRQKEVLGLLARGFTTMEIADKLGISFDTVRFHLKEIYARLGVRSRTEAVVNYLR